jgi:amino-acid N-acetyltransferase
MALSLVQELSAPSFSPSLAIPLPTENEITATSMRTRKAQLQDARSIHHLIHSFTHDGTLLPRRYAEICANISTFTIVETISHKFIGCAALHVYGQHLAEVRSIAVTPDAERRGAGRLLVRALLDQAHASGIPCVCLFTRIPAFFQRFDFRTTNHQALPDKVTKDCIHCTRRNACDEIAMAIGELPPFQYPASQLSDPQDHIGLVQLRP